MITFKSFFFFFLTILLIGCNRPEADNKDIIVRIGDEILTKTDLSMIFSQSADSNSLNLKKNYVKNWIVNQVLRQRAENNLNNIDLKTIQNMINDYETTVYVQQYKQRYIKQKLDTNITDEELVGYYKTYNFDFRLKSQLIKALMISIPIKSNQYYPLRNLLKKDIDENYDAIESFCNKHQFTIIDFNEEWINFELVNNEFNIDINSLKYQNIFSINDSVHSETKILRIKEYLLEGDTIPFQYVKNDLKKIIIHKRKQNIITKLEHTAFEDAISNKEMFVAKPYVNINEN